MRKQATDAKSPQSGDMHLQHDLRDHWELRRETNDAEKSAFGRGMVTEAIAGRKT